MEKVEAKVILAIMFLALKLSTKLSSIFSNFRTPFIDISSDSYEYLASYSFISEEGS
jgi:hypothetical protein